MLQSPGTDFAKLQQRLLSWFDASERDLPWRRTRNPWQILVSEVMLQQTQVSRVEPKWRAFVTRFPDATSCANADQSDVVRLWEGLGYHRRAVMLHRCAREIRDRHDGCVPRAMADLLALSGIGPYTARAIRTFAYEFDDGVLDTNVGRIVARAVTGRRCSVVEAQRVADALVPPGRGWAWNQAMLDLGATICAKRLPRCEQCPLADVCAWRLAGPSGPDPATGSAGVSQPQSRFVGSDREGRGRVLAQLRTWGECRLCDLPAVTGWDDPDRIRATVDSLIRDALVMETGPSTRRVLRLYDGH